MLVMTDITVETGIRVEHEKVACHLGEMTEDMTVQTQI